MTTTTFPWAPGAPVLIDDRPGFISWINEAPTPGYFWVGYEIDGVQYAGAHVTPDGSDKKGRTVFTMRRKTKVEIENTYTDGHESNYVVELDPPGIGDDALEEWWEEEVFNCTGDGHYVEVYESTGERLGSCYTATVIDTDDPRLQDESREWLD